MSEFSRPICVVVLASLVAIAICGAKIQPGFADSRQKSSAAGHPSVSELLAKFAEKRNRYTSFIIETESKREYAAPKDNRSGVIYTRCEFRVDETRGGVRWYLWGNVSDFHPNVTKEQAHYSSQLYDGQHYYEYNRVPPDSGLVIIYKENDLTGAQESLKNVVKGSTVVGEMMGYHFGDNAKRIDEVLERAEHIELREKQENLKGADCYVIDAVVKGKGKYTLWIDTVHDYHIAKVHTRRKENDHLNTRKLKRGDSSNKIYEVLHWKQIGDSWFPMKYKMKWSVHHGETGYSSTSDRIITFTNIVVNPDHEALKSFVPDDIPNGAAVNLRALPPSKEFIWRDGKVVDKDGEVIMDCLGKNKVTPKN